MSKTGSNRLPVLVNLSTNERFVMDGPSVSIGRAPDNRVLLADDEYASGTHARIYWSDNAWWVEDLGSSNGTSVDEHMISAPLKLKAGSVIKVGRTKFRIE